MKIEHEFRMCSPWGCEPNANGLENNHGVECWKCHGNILRNDFMHVIYHYTKSQSGWMHDHLKIIYICEGCLTGIATKEKVLGIARVLLLIKNL